MKKLKKRINDIGKKLSKKYVGDCHPEFYKLIESRNLFSFSLTKELSNKKRIDIMKMLNSKSYKNYFYSAVQYNVESPTLISVVEPKRFFGRMWNMLGNWVAKQYVRLFDKELYEMVKRFETISKGTVELDEKIDEYLAETSIEDRVKRMGKLGIIKKVDFKDSDEDERMFEAYQHYLPEA